MLHPNPLMLLRIAQADAYAMATEYIKNPRDDAVLEAALKFEQYVKHPTHSLKAGSYTDDTQMSIGTVEVLLEGPPFTRRKFIEAFVRAFQRDPRDGYSRAFQKFLETVKDADDFEARIRPDSVKNGACMRAVPIGVLEDPKEILEVARAQATATHDTDEGILSAQMVALMSHFALYSGDGFDRLSDFLHAHLDWKGAKTGKEMKEWAVGHAGWTPWTDPVNGKTNVAWATTQAVYTLVASQNRLLDVLRQTIEFGGDTDSVAAIAWGIASTRMNGAELPEFLEWGLEPGGKYGAGFLRELGAKLMEKYR